MSLVTRAPKFSVEQVEALRDVHNHLVVTISFLVWDIFLTLKAEVDYIWRMRSGVFKWFYFYFRYCLVAAQIFNMAISPTLSSGLASPFICMLWYEYALLLAQISLFMIDIVLAVRGEPLGSPEVSISTLFWISLCPVQSKSRSGFLYDLARRSGSHLRGVAYGRVSPDDVC